MREPGRAPSDELLLSQVPAGSPPPLVGEAAKPAPVCSLAGAWAGAEPLLYEGESWWVSDELWAAADELLQPIGTRTADARGCSDAARPPGRQGKGCSCLLAPVNGVWGCPGGGQEKSKNRTKIYLQVRPNSRRVPRLLSGYLRKQTSYCLILGIICLICAWKEKGQQTPAKKTAVKRDHSISEVT